MTKQEFLTRLKVGLSGLPKDEIEQRIVFYEEIIDDKIEEGLNEDSAVESLGGVDSVIDGILAEIPLATLVKRRIKTEKPLTGWGIALVIAGAPIWGSIIISLLAAAFSVYAVVWAVMISLWAVVFCFALCPLAGAVMLIVGIAMGNTPVGFASFGAGLFLGGVSIFSYIGLKRLTKALIKITVKIPTWIKRCFIGRESKNEQNK